MFRILLDSKIKDLGVNQLLLQQASGRGLHGLAPSGGKSIQEGVLVLSYHSAGALSLRRLVNFLITS